MITANKLKHFPFVHKYIELSEEFSYSSSVILEMYSNLISLFIIKNIPIIIIDDKVRDLSKSVF